MTATDSAGRSDSETKTIPIPACTAVTDDLLDIDDHDDDHLDDDSDATAGSGTSASRFH